MKGEEEKMNGEREMQSKGTGFRPIKYCSIKATELTIDINYLVSAKSLRHIVSKDRQKHEPSTEQRNSYTG